MRFGFCVFVFLFSFSVIFPVFAIDPADPHDPARVKAPLTKEEQEAFDKTLEDLLSVPEVLRRSLRPPMAKEDYMVQIMRFLRSNGDEKRELTKEDLAEQKEAAVLRARREQVSNLIKYDINFDAQVTFGEVERAFSEGPTGKYEKTFNDNRTEEQKRLMLEQRLKPLRELDTNGDEIISYQEMATLSKEKEKQIIEQQTRQYQQYLDLDPNHDGRLTSEEMESLALKAFAVFDKNDDGYISQEEYEPYLNVLRSYNLFNYSPDQSCSVEPVPKDATLLGVGMYQGLALSTVTAVGQDRETTTVNVKIEEDQPDLFLILSSYDPIIWRFEGHTGAVKHVLVTSYPQNENGRSASGVTGVDKSRVTFLSQKCLPYFHDDRKALGVRGMIKVLTGRFPNIVRAKHSSRDVLISQGDVTFSEIPKGPPRNQTDLAPGAGSSPPEGSEDKLEKWERLRLQQRVQVSAWPRNPTNPYNIPTPEGYDSELWSIFLKFNKAGLAEIDPSTVVSDMPAERYEVWPQMAGIAKLVHEGALVKISNREFLVTKNIPRFPAGLTGSHSVKFVIAEGVKLPKGDPGHSCVIMEETGKPVGSSPLCR
ncbi:MAG: hypothetical protein H6858_05370 [Rhodospirillales bacterium]|nr:hypothetical protein [Alphaproteobacteria bacterium]MCB9977006.1 hypothetical protein [Rhodospirillales bacterium]